MTESGGGRDWQSGGAMSNGIFRRLAISAQPSDKQSPEDRVNNWEEVYQGFDLNRARLEAARRWANCE